MRSPVSAGLALVAMLLAGCAHRPAAAPDAPPRPVYQNSGQPEDLTFAPELRINLALMTRTASGLYYQDLLAGPGLAAASGNRVRVAYAGWLPDGTLFDQSPAARPFTFDLGEGLVISGWDEGVAGMRVGGRRLLVIPPRLAYGRQSPGPGIPPNATLVFDVRLVHVEP